MYKFSKRRYLWASICVTSILTSSLFSGELTLTKEAAVARALEQNVALQAAQIIVSQAEARLRQAGRLDNPELHLRYGSDRAFNDEGERSMEVGFEQRFPVTNRLRVEQQIARDEIEIARVGLENQTRLLVHAVETAYLRVAEIEAQLVLGDEILELYARFAKFVESRIDTGEASEIETNQIKIERYAVMQAKLRHANQLELQQAELVQLLMLSDSERVKVTFDFGVPKQLPSLPVFNQSMLEAHPGYRARRLLEHRADARVDLVKANRWADVAVEVFYEEERGVDTPDGLGRDRFFGVGLSVPLPLFVNSTAAVQEQRLVSNQRAKELQAVTVEIQADVRLRRLQVQQFYKQAKVYDDSLMQLVTVNLEAMTQAYSAGQIALADLFRSQEQGYNVRSAQLELLHDYAQAIVDWESATAQQGRNKE